MIIFRALPTALTLTVLVLSLFAVTATPIGWIVMEKLLVNEDMLAEPAFSRLAEVNRSPWKLAYPRWNESDSLLTVMGNQLRGVELIFDGAVKSLSGIFSLQRGVFRFLYFLGGGIWTLLVWSFFGCAITRVALMRYTREEPIGIDEASDFAFDKFLSCFGGVAIPLLAVLALTVPAALIGLVMATNVGAAVFGTLWFIVLLISLMIAVILLGLMFAWPLIVSAISCEGQDSFDGMSRAFAYVFQRPVHYFTYALFAILFSGICWLVASAVIEGSIHTAHWATSWGMNIGGGYRSAELADPSEVTVLSTADEVLEIAQLESEAGRSIAQPRTDDRPDLISNEPAQAVTDPGSTGSPGVAFAQLMIRFWNSVARTFGAAFLYGLFWTMAAAVYLLLRRDLDATELDEIYLVDERRTYELPPLKGVADGVPQVDEDAAAEQLTESNDEQDDG